MNNSSTPTDIEDFVLDPVMLIPTDTMIEELLNRFPTVVIGYVDEEGDTHIHWEGSYPAAVGFAKILDMTLENEYYNSEDDED